MVENRPPQRKRVKLRPLFKDVIDLAALGGALAECSIECEVEKGAEVVVGDRIQIEQVLLNLLRNSSQAIGETRNGSVRLTAEPFGGWVRITVDDNGKGIEGFNPEALFSAFGPSSSGGLGVGLSICRTIIEAHGGHITAENRHDGGASFSFTLPVG